MRGIPSRIALAALLAACGGCLAPPSYVHPGTETYQQERARFFEPYPENDFGPPVEGARPREYQQPLTEADRVMPQLGERICTPQAAPAQPQVLAPPAVYVPPPCAQ